MKQKIKKTKKNEAAAIIGRMGGKASYKKRGKKGMSELGKKGMAKRWANHVKKLSTGVSKKTLHNN